MVGGIVLPWMPMGCPLASMGGGVHFAALFYSQKFTVFGNKFLAIKFVALDQPRKIC